MCQQVARVTAKRERGRGRAQLNIGWCGKGSFKYLCIKWHDHDNHGEQVAAKAKHGALLVHAAVARCTKAVDLYGGVATLASAAGDTLCSCAARIVKSNTWRRAGGRRHGGARHQVAGGGKGHRGLHPQQVSRRMAAQCSQGCRESHPALPAAQMCVAASPIRFAPPGRLQPWQMLSRCRSWQQSYKWRLQGGEGGALGAG